MPRADGGTMRRGRATPVIVARAKRHAAPPSRWTGDGRRATRRGDGAGRAEGGGGGGLPRARSRYAPLVGSPRCSRTRLHRRQRAARRPFADAAADVAKCRCAPNPDRARRPPPRRRNGAVVATTTLTTTKPARCAGRAQLGGAPRPRRFCGAVWPRPSCPHAFSPTACTSPPPRRGVRPRSSEARRRTPARRTRRDRPSGAERARHATWTRPAERAGTLLRRRPTPPPITCDVARRVDRQCMLGAGRDDAGARRQRERCRICRVGRAERRQRRRQRRARASTTARPPSCWSARRRTWLRTGARVR